MLFLQKITFTDQPGREHLLRSPVPLVVKGLHRSINHSPPTSWVTLTTKKGASGDSWAAMVAQMVKNLPANAGDGFDPRVREIPWRRKWLATPVFLSAESLGQRRSLVGYSPWGHKESDTSEGLSMHPREATSNTIPELWIRQEKLPRLPRNWPWPGSLPMKLTGKKKKRVKIVLILKKFFSQNYVYEEPWRRSMRLIQGVFLLYTSGYHLVQKTKCWWKYRT